jgi:hypothetical protein
MAALAVLIAALAVILTSNTAMQLLQRALEAAAVDRVVTGFALAFSGLVQCLISPRKFGGHIVFCGET